MTRFSDRAFYSDWWNSTSFDEVRFVVCIDKASPRLIPPPRVQFSRKWNRPVHTFLLRHVYATTISTYRLSKFSAAFITFLLSAAVHELVMLVVTKKVRLYLFLMQAS
jgi:sterol O-acyltransferase